MSRPEKPVLSGVVSRALPIILAAGLPLMAQAQTYTVKVLPKPSGATTCGWSSDASLNDLGDVLARCEYPNFNPLIWLLGSLVQQTSAPQIGGVSRSVVWRNSGSVQVLSGGYGIDFFGDKGLILGIGIAPGTSPSNATWRGTIKSTWVAPGLGKGWMPPGFLAADAISRGGRAVILHKSPQSGYAFSSSPIELGIGLGSEDKALPAPPAACRMSDERADKSYQINDAGQLAMVSTWVETEATSNGASSQPPTTQRIQPCLWDGRSWVEGPSVPTLQLSSPYLRYRISTLLTDAGELRVRMTNVGEDELAYSWKLGGELQPSDARVIYAGANGELLGGSDPGENTPVKPAMVWRNGQAIDLNTLANAPAGTRLTTAISSNTRGQILALISPAGTSRPTDRKLVLLTPK
jgi:hypothetical protein